MISQPSPRRPRPSKYRVSILSRLVGAGLIFSTAHAERIEPPKTWMVYWPETRTAEMQFRSQGENYRYSLEQLIDTKWIPVNLQFDPKPKGFLIRVWWRVHRSYPTVLVRVKATKLSS